MGVAIAAGITGLATTSTTVIVLGAVINLAIAAILGKILAPSQTDGRDTRALQRTVRNNILPRRIVYGETLSGGPYAMLETLGVDNELLSFIVVLAAHPLDDIIGFIMNDSYVAIDGRWPADGTPLSNDLVSTYHAGVAPFGSGNTSSNLYEMVKIVKNNGWGYADLQYVTNGAGQDAADDRIRAAEIGSSIGNTNWDVPSSTVRNSEGLYQNDISPALRAKLTNLAHIFMQFRYEPDESSGFPNPNFHVRGKRLYNPDLDSSLTSFGATGGSHDLDDPDTWQWSEDWTLCCLDYLINDSYGLGVRASTTNTSDRTVNEIDWAAMITSYQESSEVIDNGLSSGHIHFGSGPRYTVNGVFEVSDTPISIMEALLTSGGGELVYSQGSYRLRPGVYRAPNSLNDIINEDMMVGPLTLQTHTPRSELFNKAAGVFVDNAYDESLVKSNINLPLFVSSDFELVDPLDSSGNNPFEVIDGEEIIQHFDYPFTTRNFEAQRLARIQLERVRRGIGVNFNATLEVLKYSVGDTVYLEILNDSKYTNEVFFNRLGLDDAVQDRPVSPFTPYYKQFKITNMEYNEDFTIAVTMLEESETIYDWNNGDASPDEGDLISDLVIEDPLGVVQPPDFNVVSPDQTIEEINTATGITTHIRFTAPDRGSIINQVDRAHIELYVLEFGIVDNPSAADSADRVSAWANGGSYTPTDRSLLVQGPIVLTNLFIDDQTAYDFRLRSFTFTGRSSIWAYYSDDIGSDHQPTEPNNSNRYYIKPVNGTVIKSGVGTLVVEAREVGAAGDILLSSGDLKLYVGSLEVTVANGFPSISDGYTGTFDDVAIDSSVLVELRNDTLGLLYDTITLADITDGGAGLDATFGYIESTNQVLSWVKTQDATTFDPADVFTNMDVTFVRGGLEVARWSRRIDRSAAGVLTDGGAATHSFSGGNLATGDITPTVTFAPFGRAAFIEYLYDDAGGNVAYVAERLTITHSGMERYYILPDTTAIKNSTGTITLEARHVDETGDNLVTSGIIKLYDDTGDEINTSNGYPSPSDGYTGTLTAAEILGEMTVYVGEGAPPALYYDTVTLVDVTDGVSSVVGWFQAEFLAWRRDINGGAWVPVQTTNQVDIIFNIGGEDVARQGYEITRAANGTLTGATNTAGSPGNLNTGRISLDISGSGTTNFTITATYSFGGLIASVTETVFTVTGGDDSEFYYILPLFGTTIKNNVGTLQIEAHKATGAVDSVITSGTIQLYDPNDNLVHTDSPGNYPSPSDGYFGTLTDTEIDKDIIITLKDGPSGDVLDTIALVDVLDGTTARELIPDPMMFEGTNPTGSPTWDTTNATQGVYTIGIGTEGSDGIRLTTGSLGQVNYGEPRRGPDVFDFQPSDKTSVEVRWRWRIHTHGGGGYNFPLYAAARGSDINEANTTAYTKVGSNGLTELSTVDVWHEDSAILEIDESAETAPRYMVFGVYAPAVINGVEIDIDWVDAKVTGTPFSGQNKSGIVSAKTTTPTGQVLSDDGTWVDNAGGSGSGFSTHTITDTDSGFSWAATGSAIASSPYTLTWVSGTGIDIDVDAASDAIRVTNTAGDGTFEGLSDTSTSGKTSGSMLVWDGATDWVDTGSDVTWISGGGTFQVDGTVTVTDRVIIYGPTGLNGMTLDNDDTDFIMNALNVTGGISIINNTLIEALTSTIHADAFRSYNGTDYVVLQHNGTDVAEIEFDSTTTRLNLGLSSSAFRELRMMGGIKLQEQVAPVAATTAYGQIWVKTAVPNELWFTNDAGTAVQLGVGGGGGTVTSVSVTTANGVSGTVATPTTTPAISLTLGAITPTSTNGILAANLLSRISTEQVTGLWEFSRAVSTSIVLDNSGVGSAGIRFQNNNGTRGYLEMDNSGTFSTLTSAAAATGFSVTSAGNIAATNLSGTNTGDNAGVTSVTGGVGVDSTGGTTPSITLDVAELAVGGTLLATDHLIAANSAVSNKQLISSIPLSIFNNDLSSSDAAIELNIRADINTATPPTTELVDARLMFLDLAATDDIASVGFTNNNTFSIDNLMHGGEIRLRGQDTAGNQRTFLFGDPNAATGLYGDTEIQFWINNVEQAVLDGTDFQVDVPIKLLERAAAVGNDTGYGQLWTNSSNSHLYYTTDGGTQYQISGATGTVTSSGSPLNNEVAVFSSATDINSDSTFTWDGTTLAATNFSGNGSSLTSLTAANITAGSLAIGVNPYSTAHSSTNVYKIPFIQTTGTTSGNFPILFEAGGTFTYQASTDTLTAGTFAGLLSGTQSNTLTFSATKTTFNTLFLNERANPTTNVAGDGQIWARTEANGSRLYYTDDTDQDFPVGMAAYNLVVNQSSNMTTDTVAQSLVAGMWYSNNGTAYTLTLEPSTDTEFPVGAQLTVANQGAGTLTINEGSGGQLLYSDGSGAFTDTAGGMTLANGGYLTIIRMTTVIWYAMGAGGTP